MLFVVNGLRKGAMAVGGALAWLVFFRMIYFVLLISFIESVAAHQKQSPFFPVNQFTCACFQASYIVPLPEVKF